MDMRQLCLAIVLTTIPVAQASASELLLVNPKIWNGLTVTEKSTLQSLYIVSVAGNEYGSIIDVQGVNESTPGTNAGASMGEAYGQAMYLDHAFKGPTPNYSATNQVTAGILGALIGSTMDAPAQARVHFRYTIRTVQGNTTQIDQIGPQMFHLPVGSCVSIATLTLTNQLACDADLGSFRARYLTSANRNAGKGREPDGDMTRGIKDRYKRVSDGAVIRCKIGSMAVVRLSAQQCRDSEGRILE